MTDSSATIIIPNYNGRRYLPRLMETVTGQSRPPDEIIVVDDGSTDDGVPYLREHWPRVRLIENPRNRGFAASCNVGIRAAATPIVVLLNNDTHVDGQWLAEGLKPFENDAVAAVASLVLLADVPHLIDTAGDVYSVAGGAVKRAHLERREIGEGLPTICLSPSGVSAFYRRKEVMTVGLLDERFESYYEDVDLGLRLARLGQRCVFAPRSICYHHLSSSYDPGGWRYHYHSARNAEIVWWANMPIRLLVKYLPAHLIFLGLQVAHKLAQGHGRAYAAGKLAALGHVKHVGAKRRLIGATARTTSRQFEFMLDRRWWHLHVGSRRRRPAPGDRA
jgi:hypothetical protein